MLQSDFDLISWFTLSLPGYCCAGCSGVQSSQHHSGQAQGRMNPLIQNLIEAACCAKVVEIVRQFNHKMLQLRQKFCQIVTFIVLRSEKCTFCNTACSMFCFDLRLDTEKLRNIKITTKIHSSILIGYSCQSVLPEQISNHKIWLR